MTTYEKGKLHTDSVYKSIKSKLCSKTDIGLVVELFQKHKSYSQQYSLSEFWANDEYNILELGNDQESFFFTKEALLKICNNLTIHKNDKLKNLYVQIPRNLALKICSMYVDKTQTIDITSLMIKCRSLI